jgi:hypothetical protein
MLSRLTIRSGLLCAALLALPSSAFACTFSEAMTPLLFDELPAVPADAVAARVQILSGGHRSGTRARIIEMIRGDYPGSNLRLEPSFATSCDRPPVDGETGIVVGRVVSSSPEELVVDPIRAPSLVERGEFKIEAIRTPR